MVPCVGLQCVVVVFPFHTHLRFANYLMECPLIIKTTKMYILEIVIPNINTSICKLKQVQNSTFI